MLQGRQEGRMDTKWERERTNQNLQHKLHPTRIDQNQYSSNDLKFSDLVDVGVLQNPGPFVMEQTHTSGPGV